MQVNRKNMCWLATACFLAGVIGTSFFSVLFYIRPIEKNHADEIADIRRHIQQEDFRAKQGRAAFRQAQEFIEKSGEWTVDEVVPVYDGSCYKSPGGWLPSSPLERMKYEVPSQTFVRLKQGKQEISFAIAGGEEWLERKGKKVILSLSLKYLQYWGFSSFVGTYISIKEVKN